MIAQRVLAAGLVAALAVSALPQEARNAPADSVTWTEGGSKKTRTGVVVESAAYDEVAFSVAGRRTTIDGADLVEIRWGDAPREFDAATATLRAGDAGAALAGFEQALRARATPRGWLVEYGSTGLGEALLALAANDAQKAGRAAHAFATAREANPKSLVLDRILSGLSKAQLLLGKPDAALAAADDLAAAAKAAKRPAWTTDALLLRAEALDSRGDEPGALRALDDLVAAAESRAAAARDAETIQRLRRTATHAAARATWIHAEAVESKAAESVARAERALAGLDAKGPQDGEAQAAALNLRGAILLASGDAKAALRMFLEAEVLHFDVDEEAARAVRYQALCFERLGDDARRRERISELETSWPATEWARRAARTPR